MNPENVQAASDIRAFRRKHGLTQSHLGVHLGVSLRTVQSWEEFGPGSREVVALALAELGRRLTAGETTAPPEFAGHSLMITLHRPGAASRSALVMAETCESLKAEGIAEVAKARVLDLLTSRG